MLKLLRLLRLVKLLRILRSWTHPEATGGQLERRLQRPGALKIHPRHADDRALAGVHVEAHGEEVAEKDDWVTNYYSNWVDADRMFATCYAETELSNELHACMNLSPWNMYIASLYWALVTMSTIGYGDILPTRTERFFVILAMLIGTSVFAYVVGSVCGIVASMDKKSNEHHERMDTLNAMAREMQVGDDLQMRCRDFFRYRHSSTNIEEWFELLELMSPSLRGEVALKQCGSWINNVPFFSGGPDGFIVDIALKLKSETFPQGETIVHAGALSTKLFIVERGRGWREGAGVHQRQGVRRGGPERRVPGGVHRARHDLLRRLWFAREASSRTSVTTYPVMKRRLHVAGCRG